MRIRDYFYSDYYNIAFRLKKGDNADSNRDWTIVQSSNHEWFADPFLFERDGRRYIFAERMSKWGNKGTIAFCEIFDDGRMSSFKEVLIEPFHLSYPNVFEYDGVVYMIPETGHNKDIRIYKSEQFPYQWSLVKDFFVGGNYVDTSFVSEIQNGKAILNSFDWDNKRSHFYKFDLEELSLSELPSNPNMMNERNGGNCFVKDGSKFRVLQDCSHTYGEKIIINRIDCDVFDGGNASDSFSFEICPNNIKFVLENIKPDCCHTYNQSEGYEVIDFLAERFVWFLPFLILRRKVRSAYHKVFRK